MKKLILLFAFMGCQDSSSGRNVIRIDLPADSVVCFWKGTGYSGGLSCLPVRDVAERPTAPPKPELES